MAESDAAKRAAARKAKILARGNTGLQKLAQTARGEEADKLYGDSKSTSPSPGPAPTASTSEPRASWAPPPPTSASRPAPPQLTPEQQQMQEQLAAMFGGGPGGMGGVGGGSPDAGMPDMSRLLAQMMGMPAPEGGAGQNLLGDIDDPTGLGGAMPGMGMGGAGGMPPGMAEMFESMSNGAGGLPGMPGMPGGMSMGGPKTISKAQKYFPLVHAISMILLGLFCVIWWEPNLRAARWAGKVDGWWARRWAGLSGRQGWIGELTDELLGGVEVLPVFWAFATVQLILQTTRIMILRSPPPPHGLISNFLPLLPPGISRPILTGSRYLTLLTQIYKDGTLLIFFIGMTVVLGQWRSTGVAPLYQLKSN